MKTTPLISVIIPIYNVEKYLPQCIDSVLSQTFENFEVILVDDGSPDNSGEICDKYAQKDKRIKVFHNQNGGVSKARNFGISVAQGEYIMFLDADDFYSNDNLFEKAASKISNNPDVDLISFLISKYYDENTIIPVNHYDTNVLNSLSDMTDILENLIKTDSLYIYPVDKVIRKGFLIENSLTFREGMKNEEDAEWCLRLFPKVKKWCFIEDCSYMYRKNRKGSATSGNSIVNFQNMLNILEEYLPKFKSSTIAQEQMLINYLSYRYAILCGILVNLEDKKQKKYYKIRLKTYQWLFNYNLSGKVNKAYKIYKKFGFFGATTALQIYIKYR